MARERRTPVSPSYVARRIACSEVRKIAEEVAPRHGIEPGLLFGIMRVESAFVANAISRAAAVGLSQVRTTVASRLDCGDLFDPKQNADCGARVLARFLKYYGGNLMLALSGYNAGHGMPGNARKEQRTPANLEYVENVLRARARYLRAGCKPWDQSR
jgi:soluble lytic murein transglycosylase-like protein